MSSVTFEQVYELVMQLSLEDQQLLSELLAEQLEPDPDEGLTLKPEIAARLKAAQEAKARREKRQLVSHEDAWKNLSVDPSENAEDLFGKYANPALDKVTYEELEEFLLQAGREWEEEMDEFFGER